MPIKVKDPRTNDYGQAGTLNSAENSPWSNPLDFNQQILPPGKVNYSNLDVNTKTFRAVVSLSRTKGTFQDIQEAINFVNKTFGSGTIFIKKGTYSMSKNLTLYSNIYLLGEDNQTTVLEFNAGQNQILISGVNNVGIERICIRDGYNTKGVIYATNSSIITFRKLNFISNTAGDGSGCDIYLDNATSSVQIIEVSFNTSTNDGSFVKLIGNGVQSWFVENNIVSPLQYCFYADPTATGQGYFLTNYFQDIVLPALYGNFTNANFIGNRTFFTSSPSTQWQADFLLNSSGIVFSGNHFSAGGYGGIRATNATELEITGNRVGASGTNAIKCGSSSQITITSNTIQAPGTAGYDAINLVAGTSVVMTGNYILAVNAYGVNLDTNTKTCVVVGNRIEAGTQTLNNGGAGNIIASNA